MKAMVSSMLIVAAAVIGLCSVSPASAARVLPQDDDALAGWAPIKDVNDPHIQELGRWAVSEHVKQANDGLRFGKVVSGAEQAVSGMGYELVIEATNGAGKSVTYGALVYLPTTRQLLAFEPMN